MSEKFVERQKLKNVLLQEKVNKLARKCAPPGLCPNG